MSILIEEPPEYNPVELIRLAQQAESSLRYYHFAIAFKVSETTIGRWMCGDRNPPTLYRVWAAELKKRWQL